MPLVTSTEMFKKAYEDITLLAHSMSIIWKLYRELFLPPRKKIPL